jgi:hypothetical protein
MSSIPILTGATQSCNPGARIGYLPFDQVLLNLVTPVFGQVGLKGVTFEGAAACWLTSFAAVVASAYHVGELQHIYIILYSSFFLFLQYEYEKSTRLSFLQVRKTEIIENRKRAVQLQV